MSIKMERKYNVPTTHGTENILPHVSRIQYFIKFTVIIFFQLSDSKY